MKSLIVLPFTIALLVAGSESAALKQKRGCVVDGVRLPVNETFRSGRFDMRCTDWGYGVDGCFIRDAEGNEQSLPVGQSALVGTVEHKCAKEGDGGVRYSYRLTACTAGGAVRQVNETWTDKHIRLRCRENGAWGPIGCVLDDGSELSLNSRKVANGTEYRCYTAGRTVRYRVRSCALAGIKCNVVPADGGHKTEGEGD